MAEYEFLCRVYVLKLYLQIFVFHSSHSAVMTSREFIRGRQTILIPMHVKCPLDVYKSKEDLKLSTNTAFWAWACCQDFSYPRITVCRVLSPEELTCQSRSARIFESQKRRVLSLRFHRRPPRRSCLQITMAWHSINSSY